MEKFVKGDVVVISFPFSDLSASKKRPALVISALKGNDLILCQITSKIKYDGYSITLSAYDLEKGSLHIESNVRPNKIFTADRDIIKYKVGNVKDKKLNEVIDAMCKLLKE